MTILRGEVFFVELGPTRGREIDDKRRPVVVVSANSINRKPLVVAVIPGTSWWTGRRVYESEVKVEPTVENGLTASTVFMCHQIKALDPSRFDQDAAGILSDSDLDAIEQSLRTCLGLS